MSGLRGDRLPSIVREGMLGADRLCPRFCALGFRRIRHRRRRSCLRCGFRPVAGRTRRSSSACGSLAGWIDCDRDDHRDHAVDDGEALSCSRRPCGSRRRRVRGLRVGRRTGVLRTCRASDVAVRFRRPRCRVAAVETWWRAGLGVVAAGVVAGAAVVTPALAAGVGAGAWTGGAAGVTAGRDAAGAGSGAGAGAFAFGQRC